MTTHKYLILAMFLAGCGGEEVSSAGSEDLSSQRLEMLSLEKLAPDTFNPPDDLYNGLYEECTESKLLEAEIIYSRCVGGEEFCQAQLATNKSKIETNWQQIYGSSGAFLKSCLIDSVALLHDSPAITLAKESCYVDFERSIRLRMLSCQSVFLLVF